jgi:hypothetical protein
VGLLPRIARNCARLGRCNESTFCCKIFMYGMARKALGVLELHGLRSILNPEGAVGVINTMPFDIPTSSFSCELE